MLRGKEAITQINVEKALKGEPILDTYTFVQLRARITYEKSLLKAKQNKCIRSRCT